MMHFKESLKWIMVIAVLIAVVMFLSACSTGSDPDGVSEKPDAGQVDTPPIGPVVDGAVDIRRNASDVPAPIGNREPQKVVVELETVEVTGFLDDGSTYTYWTFDGTVPGPMIRVREGDTVELRLKNNEASQNVHSIDLHSVNGPGGGAEATQVVPGETRAFTFKAMNPGVYVYHCASPHIPTHIALGMYGLIVVEPASGLEPVDREFYVMQGEIYTKQERVMKGNHEFDGKRLLDENPSFVVFNGRAMALTGDMAMKAKVGEKIRIFVGNGGPNLISSFHVIGEIFDKVHPEGATESVSNVQTTVVPAGGAAWVEFTLDVPGVYKLVDHSLSRLDKGALALIEVEGPENTEVFQDLGAQ